MRLLEGVQSPIVTLERPWYRCGDCGQGWSTVETTPGVAGRTRVSAGLRDWLVRLGATPCSPSGLASAPTVPSLPDHIYRSESHPSVAQAQAGILSLLGVAPGRATLALIGR